MISAMTTGTNFRNPANRFGDFGTGLAAQDCQKGVREASGQGKGDEGLEDPVQAVQHARVVRIVALEQKPKK